MSNKTRKHIWPVSLVMSIAIIGALAAFIVLAGNPGSTEAHRGGTDHAAACAAMDANARAIHNTLASATGGTPCPDPGDTTTGTGGTGGDTGITQLDAVEVVSDSASKDSDIIVTIPDVPAGGLASGSSIVVYLEDEFSVPESVPASSIYFVAKEPTNTQTGGGSRVRATDTVKIDGDTYFTTDTNDDHSIRIFIPDMCPSQVGASNECVGFNGPEAGQMLTMVMEGISGIRSPSEAGNYEVGYSILNPLANQVPGHPEVLGREQTIRAKIGVSDVDNKRGYELLVTGTGFNDKTTAGAYVLANADSAVETWWDGIECEDMKMYMGYERDATSAAAQQYCGNFNKSPMLSDSAAARVRSRHTCRIVTEMGTSAGSATVGSDDKVAITLEVTSPTFKPGAVNYICLIDGESRRSSNWKVFNLQPSIKVVPSTANSGDTVNVLALDFPGRAALVDIQLAKQSIFDDDIADVDGDSIGPDGTATARFDVPGRIGGRVVQGTVRVDAKWGDVSKSTILTIVGSELLASKTDVRPNDTITINGNGFGEQTCVPLTEILLSDVPMTVDRESIGCEVPVTKADGVQVSNSGQFVATVTLWPKSKTDSNPTLIAGTHRMTVTDHQGFSGSVNFTIAEPTITVTPDVAGPRDYITITGAGWPVDNPENPTDTAVKVEIFDREGNEARPYTAYADNAGRFTIEHRVNRTVGIPSNPQVKANHGDVIIKVSSFSVPASTITVTPGSGQPGDFISLSASNLPVYNEVDYVEIGGTKYNDPGVNTDRDGNVTG